MIRRIFSYSGQYKKYLIFAALCITGESIFELLIPLIMADIVDIGVANGDRAYIFQQGGWMLVCADAALLLGIGIARFAAIGLPGGRTLELQLDWILQRGLRLEESRVVSTRRADCTFARAGSALAGFQGQELSDHNVVWARLVF